MHSPLSSSRSGTPHPDLSYSVGDVLRERARVPENAPRIKIGDQHYHVVRIVGGRYEAPISNPRELEKVIAIGEVYFSAHKKHAEAEGLSDKEITYINEEGVHYEDGTVVSNEEVSVRGEEGIDYLKASGNYAWQQEVIRFEEHLDTFPPTHTFPNTRAIPQFLYRYAIRQGHGPYTVQQVKKFLLEYTRDKLLEAHEVHVVGHRDPKRHREDITRAIDRQIDSLGSAKDVINARNDYFKAGYLSTNNLWQMMVRILQPGEMRLLPDVEEVDSLLDRGSSHSVSSPIPIPRRGEHRRTHSADFSQSHFARGLDSSFRAPPRHLTPPSRSASFEHGHDPRVSHHPQAFTPRLAREEVRDSVVVRDRSPSLSPSLPPHMRTGSEIPPLRLDQSSMLQQPARVATVVDRVDTHTPVSHLPSDERGREEVLRSPSPLHSGEMLFEMELSSPRRDVVVPFDASPAHRVDSKSPIPRSAQMSSHLSGAHQRRQAPQWDRTYLDSSAFRTMGSTYRDIEIAAKSASSNDWADSRESKRLCETALQKFRTNMTGTLTPKELSVIKRIIEIREHNKADRGAFSRLPTSERYRAIVNDLEQYTAPYAIPLSKG